MAKFCGSCGTQVNSNEKFCLKCGAQLEQEEVANVFVAPDNAPKSDKNAKKNKPAKSKKVTKAKVITISVLSLILVLVITLAIVFLTSPSFKVYTQFNKGNYDDAKKIYVYDVKDNFLWKALVSLELKDNDAQILEEYKNNTMNYNDAKSAMEALVKMEFEGAKEKLDEINNIEASRNALDKGDKFYSDGDYESAIEEYSKVGKDSENYDTAQKKLKKIYPEYIDSVVDTASDYQADKEYEKAISYIDTAAALLPDDVNKTKLTDLRESCVLEYRTSVLDEVNELIDEQEYTEAMTLIDDAIAVDDNEEFHNAKQNIEDSFAEDVTTQVNKYLEKEDYISAKRVADDAVKTFPENQTLKDLAKEVEKATPTYLLDVCKPYASEDYAEFVNGETVDMGGNSYTNGFVLGDDGYADFNIEGNYKKMTFIVGHRDGTDMDDENIKIYCDGVLSKTIKMKADALPKKVTLDVTGVDHVKFEISRNHYDDQYGITNITVK